MFKKILLATIAVVSLAGAAHAQTTSIDAVCARPDLTPPQQIMCSTPRLRANGQRNLIALLQLASKLNPADQAELVRSAYKRAVVSTQFTVGSIPIGRRSCRSARPPRAASPAGRIGPMPRRSAPWR